MALAEFRERLVRFLVPALAGAAGDALQLALGRLGRPLPIAPAPGAALRRHGARPRRDSASRRPPCEAGTAAGEAGAAADGAGARQRLWRRPWLALRLRASAGGSATAGAGDLRRGLERHRLLARHRLVRSLGLVRPCGVVACCLRRRFEGGLLGWMRSVHRDGEHQHRRDRQRHAPALRQERAGRARRRGSPRPARAAAPRRPGRGSAFDTFGRARSAIVHRLAAAWRARSAGGSSPPPRSRPSPRAISATRHARLLVQQEGFALRWRQRLERAQRGAARPCCAFGARSGS